MGPAGHGQNFKLFKNGSYLAILLSSFIVAQGSIDPSSNPGKFPRGATCRSRGVNLSPENFQMETCALCYLYMPPDQFKSMWRKIPAHLAPVNESIGSIDFTPDPRIHLLTDGNETVAANHSDLDSPLVHSFISDVSYHLWRECCEAAIDCCHKMIENQKPALATVTINESDPDDLDPAAPIRCPPTWDGWQCWEDGGSPGRIEYRACPSYIYFHTGAANDGGHLMQNTCGRYAEKNCTPSGQWYRKSAGEWTDFTTCSRVNALLLQEHTHMGLYAVSATALLPAIVIFFSYKVLRVPRIAIHKNMFASLLLHCIFMLTFKEVVLLPFIQTTPGPDASSLLQDNDAGCRFLLMLTMYFRLTNYTWMFCEGYYLHRLLANTFEEERSLAFILTIGWGVPILPCLAYALLRLFFDDSQCWALPAGDENGWIEWVYMTPGLICILSNFVFFINIFRILVTKLQAPHANEPAHFRKAVRATVVLLPLFGLHWLLTLYRPQSGHCLWTTIYKYVNVMLDGLQGLMVSIAFCYRNGEIRNLLRTSWKRLREHFCPQDHATIMQLSEFHRGGSETCFTQVPVPKHENNHHHNNEENVTSALLPPSSQPKTLKSVIVLEPHGQASSCAPSPSTRSINSTGSGSVN